MATSKILPVSVPLLRQFTVTIKNASVTRISGATGGALVLNFLGEDGVTSVNTITQALTTTASTYVLPYTGATNLKVSSVQVYTMGTATGNQSLKFSIGTVSINAYATPYWLGYIDPSNLERSWLAPNYFINLNAVDGLGDLKQINMPFTGITSGSSVSMLATLKQALSQTGIQLDFRVQNNIYEANGGANYNSLQYFINPVQRFNKIDNGVSTPRTCYDVASSILNTFNLRLFQNNNYYNLISLNEVNSRLKYYKWSDLSSTGQSNYNRAINIDSYKATIDTDTLSKVRPLKSLVFPLTNQYLGSNFLLGKSFVNGTSPNDFGHFSYDPASATITAVNSLSFSSGPNASTDTSSQTFSITNFGTGNTITVSFDCTMSGTWSSSSSLFFPQVIQCDLMSGSTVAGAQTAAGTLGVISGLNYNVSTKHYSFTFPIHSTFTASVRLWVIPAVSTTYTVTSTLFSNLSATQFIPTNIVFDQQFNATNPNSKAIAIDDTQTLDFYDNSINTIATVHYSTTVTTKSWSNFSGLTTTLNDTNVPLSQLFSYNRLKSRQKFLDYRLFELRNNTVDIYNAITLHGKNYNINAMTNNLMVNTTQIEMYENPSTALSGLTFQAFTLSTSNN
jgi:hypothetical protein